MGMCMPGVRGHAIWLLRQEIISDKERKKKYKDYVF